MKKYIIHYKVKETNGLSFDYTNRFEAKNMKEALDKLEDFLMMPIVESYEVYSIIFIS